MSAHKSDLAPTDFYHTFNGFDEIAVAKAFGQKPIGMSQAGDQESFGRCLLFTLCRRDGLADDDAYAFAMAATVGELKGAFADEDAEPIPEEPVSAGGKEPSTPATTPSG